MTGFSRKDVEFILDRDGGVCLMWGSNPFCAYYADTANHRINRGQGGSKRLNVRVNGCAICARCNGLIEHSSTLAEEARRRGVKVRSSYTAAKDLEHLCSIPLLHPVSGLYHLSPVGDKVSDETL